MTDILHSCEKWDRSNPEEKEHVAKLVEHTLAPHLHYVGLETYAQGDQQHTLAVFTWKGNTFILLPGYHGSLGYDERLHTLPEKPRADDEGYPPESGANTLWKVYLAEVLTPLRHVTLPPFLVAKQPIILERDKTFSNGGWVISSEPIKLAEIFAQMHEEGFRLMTSDEWEYAYSGGTRNFFRWGNEWPSIHWTPVYQREAGLWREDLTPNAFGLLIGQNPWDLEYCADNILRGGDGGTAVSSEAGRYAEWLVLSIPYCSPFFERAMKLLRRGGLRRAISLPETLWH